MGGTLSVVGTIFGQFTQAGNFGRAGYLEHSKNFNPKDLEVDLSGKHFLITGANSGIGKETALQLSKLKGTVHLLCRNKERGEEARLEIMEKSQNQNVHVHVLDISLLASVRKFAQDWLQEGTPIDALVHNAGALLNKREETSEGFEQTFACHVLGPFLLTALLLPRLKESRSRVIWVSSAGMYTRKLNVHDLQSRHGEFDGTTSYALMKRAQIILTEMWAQKLEKEGYQGVTVNAMHPGWTMTPGVESLFQEKPVYQHFAHQFRELPQGADTLVWLCAKKELKESGKFFF